MAFEPDPKLPAPQSLERNAVPEPESGGAENAGSLTCQQQLEGKPCSPLVAIPQPGRPCHASGGQARPCARREDEGLAGRALARYQERQRGRPTVDRVHPTVDSPSECGIGVRSARSFFAWLLDVSLRTKRRACVWRDRWGSFGHFDRDASSALALTHPLTRKLAPSTESEWSQFFS